MKSKNIVLGVVLTAIICSCKDESGDDSRRITNPGYVAFDYTMSSFRDYEHIFSCVFQFNEYNSQTTVSKRDSVDNLYFSNVKISHDEKNDIWTLKNMVNFKPEYIAIKPDGKKIIEDGAKWNISFRYNNSGIEENTFEIENKGGNVFQISRHDGKNYEFETSVEWEITTKGNGCDEYEVSSGKGILTSFATPKLKLEYTIIEPFKINPTKNNDSNIKSGAFEILATDMNLNSSENIKAKIISNNKVEITYKNYTESWDYFFYNYTY